MANRGLISQKELEADEIAVERLNGQLKTKKEELKQEQQEQGSVRETELLTNLEQATTKLEKLGRMERRRNPNVKKS